MAIGHNLTGYDMFLLIDNYDSFTYNLYHLLAVTGADVRVERNDAATVAEIADWQPEAIVLSPGPGLPESAGVSVELIREMSGKVPIFGVCLGHQAIAEAFGGRIIRAETPVHGKIGSISHLESGLFAGLPSPLKATRYHSLVIERASLPAELEVSAEISNDHMIMAIQHRDHPTIGVQFHPESIGTDVGPQLIDNFVAIVEAFHQKHGQKQGMSA